MQVLKLGNRIFFTYVMVKMTLLVAIVALTYLSVPATCVTSKKVERFLVNCSGIGYPLSPCTLRPDTVKLDLSHNNIKIIQQQNFQNLTKLKVLFLQFNQITKIEPGSFAKNSELQYLDLSNNLLHDISGLPFNNLQSITHLDITNNRFETANFGAEISRLKKLHTLRFGNARLSSLNSSSLFALYTIPIKEIYLITGELQTYEPGTLSMIQSMEKFSLDLQFRQQPQLLINIFKDIPKTTTTLEILNADLMEYGNNVDLFFPLKTSNVSTLVVKNFSITDALAIYFFNGVLNSKIKNLYMHTITMNGIGNWDVPTIPAEKVHLRRISITDVSNPNFYKFYSLSYLINIFSQLQELSIIRGSMFYVQCEITEILTFLTYLDVTSNLLHESTLIPETCSSPLPNLKTLILNKNQFTNLQRLSRMTTRLKNLSNISVTHNDVLLPNGATCTWLQTMKHMDLSHNRLEGNVFECLPESLESLDLSYNSIATVPNLKRLKNLQEIFLTGNVIASLPEITGHSLKTVHIDYNEITNINVDLLQSWNLTEVKLSNNPFECLCSIQSFSNYIQQTNTKVLNWPDQYRCHVPRKFRDQVIKYLEFSPIECKIPLFIGLFMACVAIVMAVCVILCIKYKVTWYMRTLWLWLKAKRNLDVSQIQANYEFNAFISYSEHDASWVKNKLLVQLEDNDPPYRICIHERDFKPGKPIITNIIDCISKSYKTIFILSKHFVQSEWCHYEFFFAHQQVFDDRQDSLILLLLEPIPKNSIPDRFCKLRKLMNRNTYLEWPQGEFQQGFFWRRLKAVLNLDFHSNCSTKEHSKEGQLDP
ncbi:toll-like receptor 2 type-2 [Hemitrygon akajei]|uniref:toll-like receptor 2 type-2 n=1 Tax=Hemitrygon akajei TaxID=2704970 RepID=UPI003BF9578D